MGEINLVLVSAGHLKRSNSGNTTVAPRRQNVYSTKCKLYFTKGCEKHACPRTMVCTAVIQRPKKVCAIAYWSDYYGLPYREVQD